MNTKTMEGLVGARTNMNLLNTPFRVYKEARRKGDTATMERAMGYVNEFSDQAYEYKKEADEGMKEEAEAAREKAKEECEKAIQNRKEEREKSEERMEESRDENKETDTAKVGGEGEDFNHTDVDYEASAKVKTDKEPVIYTKTGAISSSGQNMNRSISVEI